MLRFATRTSKPHFGGAPSCGTQCARSWRPAVALCIVPEPLRTTSTRLFASQRCSNAASPRKGFPGRTYDQPPPLRVLRSAPLRRPDAGAGGRARRERTHKVRAAAQGLVWAPQPWRPAERAQHDDARRPRPRHHGSGRRGPLPSPTRVYWETWFLANSRRSQNKGNYLGKLFTWEGLMPVKDFHKEFLRK